MDKFTEVYNKIINECNETAKQNKIIEESLLRKAEGLFKSKKEKNKMMKETIIRWMNANKFKENGIENKFIGKLPNGYQLKFTFSQSAWTDPKSTEIKYAVYLMDNEGNKKSLVNNKGVISYSYSENDIKKELTKKLQDAMRPDEAKSSFTTKKQVDKESLKAKKAADKEAAKQKAEEERITNAEKEAQELQE